MCAILDFAQHPSTIPGVGSPGSLGLELSVVVTVGRVVARGRSYCRRRGHGRRKVLPSGNEWCWAAIYGLVSCTVPHIVPLCSLGRRFATANPELAHSILDDILELRSSEGSRDKKLVHPRPLPSLVLRSRR